MLIKNFEQLCSNAYTAGERRARELALLAFGTALVAIDPQTLVKTRLSLANGMLRIDKHCFELDKFRNIYVIGGGKASGAMAAAVEQILGARLTRGCVNIPHETVCSTNLVTLNRAGHPVPDLAGVVGTRQMIKLVEMAGIDDLIISLVSGGGSSLMPLPRAVVTLADKRELTGLLLKSGASINEINTVRKHVSDFKGGWLARRAYPATVLNLVLSDVIGDPLDSIASGPTVPDSTTFADAESVLRRYDLLNRIPSAVQELLTDGLKGVAEETPKSGDPAFDRVCNVVIGNNQSALTAVCNSLRAEGLEIQLLPAPLQGEAMALGQSLAVRMSDASLVGRPLAIIGGGEATVTVRGSGLGGRNQEIALGAVQGLAGADNVLLAVLATDGIDGPTDACGALVDGSTLARTKKLGLEPELFAQNNDSYGFFKELGDLVYTGYTGSNVNDVYIAILL
ncbi:MAG: DUF4147 domain-containing protein [Candidatus Riflebacteria bacterium]|nr:DUF4147 domain-containing protein [Candidatus Riflebacteria bacterium]